MIGTKFVRGMVSTLLVAGVAAADTIYMKNGVQVDGVIQKRANGRIFVQVGPNRVALRENEVAKIEENDKTGHMDLEAAKERARKRNQLLEERTGLTVVQRAQVEKLLKLLKSSDRDTVNKGVTRLVALGQKINVMKYLEYFLPSMLPYSVPGCLEVAFQLSPIRALPLIQMQVKSPDERCRAKALELLGRLQDKEAGPVVTRGLIDHEPVVRIAASYALAALRYYPATPVLLENLDAHDLRVQNAAKRALSYMWSTDESPVSFETKEEWRAFWREKVPSVESPVNPLEVRPLVPPGTEFRDE